ncbi:hypothetical protein [Curtobacterium ammoniigenes]|uniref:hypothetical protein n=1 Tax=Curtobacterium ammoniigenes TaxID=395387 RepID=UPI000830A808|nr:hypothetical protein [Curtobacterium ammoniigenes]
MPESDAGPVDFQTTTIVLAANEPDLLETLRMGALRAGVAEDRLIVQPAIAPLDPPDGAAPGLAVVAVRRGEHDSPFQRGVRIAERLAPGLDPHALQVVFSIPVYARLAPKLERLLTVEMLHQLDIVGAVGGVITPWRSIRLRVGYAGLRAAGVRVFRLKLRP